jgi:hypothetical protein
MDNWQATFLGLKHLPRELTAFEMEVFFTFTSADRQMIEDRRRSALKPAASGLPSRLAQSAHPEGRVGQAAARRIHR